MNMTHTTTATEGNNPQSALVVITEAEQEQPDINQLRFEALNALEREFCTFRNEAIRRMHEYDKALGMVTCDLYKEVLAHTCGSNRIGLASDYIINGLHGQRRNGLEQVKTGLADMHDAMYQAKSYCFALSETLNKRQDRAAGGTA